MNRLKSQREKVLFYWLRLKLYIQDMTCSWKILNPKITNSRKKTVSINLFRNHQLSGTQVQGIEHSSSRINFVQAIKPRYQNWEHQSSEGYFLTWRELLLSPWPVQIQRTGINSKVWWSWVPQWSVDEQTKITHKTLSRKRRIVWRKV